MAWEELFIGTSKPSFSFQSLTCFVVLSDYFQVRVKSHIRVRSQIHGFPGCLQDPIFSPYYLSPPLLQTLPPHSSSCSTTTTPCSREGAKYSTGLDIRLPPLLPGSKPRLGFPLPRRLETVDNPLWFISPFFRPGIFRQKHPPKNRST